MTRLHEQDRSHKPTNFLNDRLSALLIPVLTAIEREWRGPVDPSQRPYLRMAHMGLGEVARTRTRGRSPMTAVLEHILASTDAKPTGPDKFFGHGPCHGSQRHRDLSIRVTSDRILIYCFAGCGLNSILSALGLTVRDLFFDSNIDPREVKKQRARRAQERQHKADIEATDGLTIDALREADYFIRSRHGLDISQWSDAHLDAELNALANAYTLLEHEDLDGLR